MDCRALFEPLGREAPPEVAGALLTPGDIDLLADRGAALLAHAINRASSPASPRRRSSPSTDRGPSFPGRSS